MKILRNFNALILATALIIFGCGEEPYNLNDGGFQLPGGSNVVSGATNGSYLLGLSPEVSFDIATIGSVSSVTVFMTLNTNDTSSMRTEVGQFDVSGDTTTVTLSQSELFSVPVDGSTLTENDLDPNDTWIFDYEFIVDGTTYSGGSSNFHTLTFTCFVDPNSFIGTYTLDQVVGSADPFFGEPTKFDEGTVTISAGAKDTERVITTRYLGFDDIPITVDLVCGEVIVIPGQAGTLGCADGPLNFGASSNLSTFDASDDSTLEITFTDDVDNGCGLTEEMVLRLTKQ